jgi:LEA14-like dessication related protein
MMKLPESPARAPLAAAVLAVALLGGCATLKEVAASGLEKPSVELTAVDAEGLDLSGVTLQVRLRVDNPNPVALKLATLRYKLAVEDQQVFDGVMPQGVQLAARGPTQVSLPVRLRWLDLPGLAQSFLARREVGCKVSGIAGIGTAFGVLDVPFEHVERVRAAGER